MAGGGRGNADKTMRRNAECVEEVGKGLKEAGCTDQVQIAGMKSVSAFNSRYYEAAFANGYEIYDEDSD